MASVQLIFAEGGIADLSGAGGASLTLSGQTSQDRVSVTGTGALSAPLPADAADGAVKRISLAAAAVGTSLVVTPPAGGALLNGTAVLASLTLDTDAVGETALVQHLVGGTYRLVHADPNVDLA